jgi:murein DD-endopeptidase MepM/ murein hydrolase activator NlpD
MHAPHIRAGNYKYFLLEKDTWTLHFLSVDRLPFNKWKAAKWSSNIYFAAAFLSVFKQQCRQLDKAFSGVEHRHHLSHWFYGERVKEIEPEDRILTARRRLLSYYLQKGSVAAGTFSGVALVSPLDGVPRLVLDDFGNKRGNKRGPGHQGIDITAQLGEPVRAVGAGRVVFAGVDLKGQAASKQLSPKQAAVFSARSMGAGGVYVAINHGGGFRTYYMHLNSLTVKDRDEVKAGHIIGTVGRSGTATSGPHLHLEFRTVEERVDPAASLSSVLVDPSRFDSALPGGSD